MSEKPLPRGSGIGRAAKREPGSESARRGAPMAGARVRGSLCFLSPDCDGDPSRAGLGLSRGGLVSNATPTLATKPIRWANLPHPLWVGISVKMFGAEPVLVAAARCALPGKEGWAS